MNSEIYCADAIEKLKEIERKSVDCIFTSPDPIQNYRNGSLRKSEAEYIQNLVEIFKAAIPVLKDSGVVFVHMNDSFDLNGSLRQIPFKFAEFMKDWNEGQWLLRADLIWHRTIAQESKTTFKRDCEHILMFSQMKDHYFNPDFSTTSLLSFPYYEPKRGEWFSGFPEDLIKICLISGCPPNGIVLDPLMGSGITGKIALQNNRNFIGIDKDERMVINATKELDKIR